MTQHIIGSLEHVAFPEFGIGDIVAKVDTGAYTGALHCTKIHEEQTENGPVLRFSPFDSPEVEIVANDYFIKPVRSSNGDKAKRFFVKTTVSIRGKTYQITLSLANRSEMRWPVLIGRKFLRHNRFLVDAGQLKAYREPKKET